MREMRKYKQRNVKAVKCKAIGLFSRSDHINGVRKKNPADIIDGWHLAELACSEANNGSELPEAGKFSFESQSSNMSRQKINYLHSSVHRASLCILTTDRLDTVGAGLSIKVGSA